MNAVVGSPTWPLWVALFVGTAAFWAVVFLAVRALFVGRGAGGPHTRVAPCATDSDGVPDEPQDLDRFEPR